MAVYSSVIFFLGHSAHSQRYSFPIRTPGYLFLARACCMILVKRRTCTKYLTPDIFADPTMPFLFRGERWNSQTIAGEFHFIRQKCSNPHTWPVSTISAVSLDRKNSPFPWEKEKFKNSRPLFLTSEFPWKYLIASSRLTLRMPSVCDEQCSLPSLSRNTRIESSRSGFNALTLEDQLTRPLDSRSFRRDRCPVYATLVALALVWVGLTLIPYHFFKLSCVWSRLFSYHSIRKPRKKDRWK